MFNRGGFEPDPTARTSHLDIYKTPLRGAGWIAASAFQLAAAANLPWELPRNHIPEPFDVPDHITNLGGSLFYGAFAARLAMGTISRFTASPERAKQVTVSLAALGALVVNSIVESKHGLQAMPQDWTDVAYGTIGGAIGATYVDPGYKPGLWASIRGLRADKLALAEQASYINERPNQPSVD